MKRYILMITLFLGGSATEKVLSQENTALPLIPVMSTAEFEEQKRINIIEDSVEYTKSAIASILSSPTIRIENKMLLNVEHPWAPGNYIIHANLTRSSPIERQIFGINTKMDIDAICRDRYPENAVSFHLDNGWDRIIYAKKSGNYIRAYGHNPGDYDFTGPIALAADINDSIYVVQDGGWVVVLWFDHNDNSGKIKFSRIFQISGVFVPIDIAIDQSGSLSNPSNPAYDRIWIAYDFSGKLVCINRGGTILREITHYMFNNNTYRLNKPFKVQTQEIGGRVAFIDRERNAFVTFMPPASGTTANAINHTAFPKANSSLSCIGQDINNEWWVGDELMKMYHKFTQDGRYLASYDGVGSPSGQFASPVAISKAPYYKSGVTIYRTQYAFTSDRWGDNTGMRAFFPGADALDISFDPSIYNQCNAFVNFTLTNQAYVRGRLTMPPDTTTIAFYDYGTRTAGRQTVNIDKLKFRSAPTNYRFQLAILPRYWSTYGIVLENWSMHSIDFTSPPPPSWGASIFPVPSHISCFTSLTRGEWRVVPLCESNYTYDWYKNNYIGSNNWERLNKFTQQINFLVGTEQFELKCVVTHINGSSYTAYYTNCPPPPPPPSCPYVYTYDGKKFHEDNNILPQIEYPENMGKDVTDYYRLLKPLKTKNGKYILQIREFENEQSFFDQFKLLAIDHSVNTKIDVSPATGEIYQYVTPFRLSRASVRSKNVLSELAEFDSTRIIVNPGDTLSLSLQQTIVKSSFMKQSSLPGGGEGGGDGLPKINKMAYNAQPSGTSTSDGVITFRQRPTLVFAPMTLDSLTSWNLVWTQRARLDYLNFGLLVSQPYQTNELSLVSAKHSAQIDVKASLLSIDSNYAILSPGESIELQFQSIPSLPSGKKRTFVLVSRGRYERITDSSRFSTYSQPEVNSFGLNSVYPNPFNPFTTISFQQPVDGYTKVVIYDLLGREVMRLVDAGVLKGSYSVSWDASNVSSGLYFCRFIVSNSYGKVLYNEVKKLVVTK